jgi:hypothetical protein
MKNRVFRDSLIILSVFSCVLIAPSYAFGQSSYYISSGGNDSTNNGKSAAAPWRTIAKVNASTFVPGDCIFFARGDTFSGQITIGQSGTAGSPVLIGAYGTANEKPIIKGSEPLTGWTLRSNGIYATKATSHVKNLFVEGVQMTIARYPNTGFITVDATNGTTTITSSGISQPSGTWNGANVRYRANAYRFAIAAVVSQTGTTITLSGGANSVDAGCGLYLDNKLIALDVPGEWYCDTITDSVYCIAPNNVDPGTVSIEGSVTDYGVSSAQTHITVQDIEFKHQSKAALSFTVANNIRIVDNDIHDGWGYGIYLYEDWNYYDGPDDTSLVKSCYVDGNKIGGFNAAGICIAYSQRDTISNNEIKHIGLVQGYVGNITENMMGIFASGGYRAVVRGNVIDSTGYCGIACYGTYWLVENNVVTNTVLKLCDGGGIYTYGQNNRTYGGVWRNNIVENIIGNADAYSGSYSSVFGIYLDFLSHDMTVEGNTVINSGSNGIFTQYNDYNNTFRNNIVYISGDHSIYHNIDTAYNYGGNTIVGNVFFHKKAGQAVFQLVDLSNTYHGPGVLDSNYYCHTKADYAVNRLYFNANASNEFTLEQWQSFCGQDAHSKTMYAGYSAEDNPDTIFVNRTSAPHTVSLAPYTYRDLDGNSLTDSLTLAAYSSEILFRDSLVTYREGRPRTRSMQPFLRRIFPNPFISGTIIFTLAKSATTSLVVYAVSGIAVRVLIDQAYVGAGKHEVEFNPNGLPGGMYFIKLAADKETLTEQMIILK